MIPHSDPELSGFRLAFDTTLVGKELQELVGFWPVANVPVGSCRLLRYRHRPGERAIFSYEIETGTKRSAHEQPLWVTGSIYKGDKSKRLYDKFAHKQTRKTGPSGTSGVSYVSKLNMLVELYPADRKLVGLAEIASGLPASLGSVFLASFGPSGAWQIETIEITPVRYRPHIGAVYRYRATARSHGGLLQTKSFYVKLYRADEAAEIFDKSLRVTTDLCRGNSTFRLAKPLAHLPEHGAIVWTEMPGLSLAGMLLAGTLTTDGVRQTASALHHFHSSDLRAPMRPAGAIVKFETGKTTQQLQRACPQLENAVRTVALAIAERFQDGVFAATHLDMKPEHVLIEGNNISIIDIETIALSDPALDAGGLVARLWAVPEVVGADRSKAEDVAQAFAECWRMKMPGNVAAKLRAATALGFLKVIRFAIEHQIPGWRDHVETHLSNATRALAGKPLITSPEQHLDQVLVPQTKSSLRLA